MIQNGGGARDHGPFLEPGGTPGINPDSRPQGPSHADVGTFQIDAGPVQTDIGSLQVQAEKMLLKMFENKVLNGAP